MVKKLIAIRASENTARQIAALKQRMGTTQTDVVSIAIDRLAREELPGRPAEREFEMYRNWKTEDLKKEFDKITVEIEDVHSRKGSEDNYFKALEQRWNSIAIELERRDPQDPNAGDDINLVAWDAAQD